MTPLALSVLLPFIGALLVVYTRRNWCLRNNMLIATGLLNLALLVSIFINRGDYGEAQVLFETLPGLSVAFRLEPLGMIFALTAGVLWPITSVYSISYLQAYEDPHQTRFHALFCVAIGAAMGIALAENLFTLFLFYEILTFSTWPLVTHNRTPDAVSAGRVYLGVLLTTSLMLFLLGIVIIGNFGDSLSFVPGGVLSEMHPAAVSVLLVMFLFGIGKAAVMPFHRWLPNAMVAPAPVSALLHAVAVVKAGVFTILKVCYYTFGFDVLKSLEIYDVIVWVPAVTVLLASAIAMKQDDIKARLAYSTVSQLSYIVLGALLASQIAFLGSAMHITMHAFGKITLFFCAGAIAVFAGKKNVSDMNGLGRSMPWTFGAFLVASLSIAGLPPTGGLWSKWYIALGALDQDQIALVVVLMVSSLLNVYYLCAIPFRAFFLSGNETVQALENRPPMVTALVITAAASVALFFLADDLLVIAGEVRP